MAVTNTAGFDINVNDGGVLELQSASTLTADALRINNGHLTSYINLSFPVATDFELAGGAANMLGPLLEIGAVRVVGEESDATAEDPATD